MGGRCVCVSGWGWFGLCMCCTSVTSVLGINGWAIRNCPAEACSRCVRRYDTRGLREGWVSDEVRSVCLQVAATFGSIQDAGKGAKARRSHSSQQQPVETIPCHRQARRIRRSAPILDLHTSRGPCPPVIKPSSHQASSKLSPHPSPCVPPASAPRQTLFPALTLSLSVLLESRDFASTSAVLRACFLPVVLVSARVCVAFASHVRSLLSLRCCVM